MNKAMALLTASGSLAGALLAGGSHRPSADHPRTKAWYASLQKPSFAPPKPAYGAVWGGLGLLLVFSGYRLLAAPPGRRRSRAVALWGATVSGIGLWPRLFFKRRNLPASLAASGAMTVSAMAAASAAARVDRAAGLASLPLIAWLGFATLLDEEIWRRN